jgi:hypothetical protein
MLELVSDSLEALDGTVSPAASGIVERRAGVLTLRLDRGSLRPR